VRLLSAPWSSRRRVRFRVRVDRFPRRAVKGDAFSLDRDQASSSTRAKKGPPSGYRSGASSVLDRERHLTDSCSVCM
jgi:hypothetical protein